MRVDTSDFIFTGRGSTALWAILSSLDKPGARIIVPVNVCEIIVPVILKAGMVPVYCDVDERTGLSTLGHIVRAHTGNESALLAVHNFGMPLEINAICDWAKSENIFVIEDVCNALGASFQNRELGQWADAAIFSFGYVKIVECGFGGAAVVRDISLRRDVQSRVQSLETYADIHKQKNEEYQGQLREIRNRTEQQNPDTYQSLYRAYTKHILYQLDDTSVQEIKSQVAQLGAEVQNRSQKADRYRSEIRCPWVSHIPEREGQVYWRYNLLVPPELRDTLVRYLRSQDVTVSTWYPPVVPLFYKEFNSLCFSGSTAFGNSVVNLLVDRRVDIPEIERTSDLINGKRWLSR